MLNSYEIKDLQKALKTITEGKKSNAFFGNPMFVSLIKLIYNKKNDVHEEIRSLIVRNLIKQADITIKIAKDTDEQKYLLNKPTIHTIADVALSTCAELPDKRMQVKINIIVAMSIICCEDFD